MRTFDLFEGIEFNERNAHAESLHSNEEGRALRFAFLPGQRIEPHESPHSPVHLIILQGRGMFAGADGVERECSEGMMIAFDSEEPHTVRALDEKLVYVAIYKENPATHMHESEHRQMLEKQSQHHDHSHSDERGATESLSAAV
jgi:quercetin dioxygenase-like cupin family protein